MKKWLYKLAFKILAKRIVNSTTPLTPEHLLKMGWIEKGGKYFEPDIKNRDRITITFDTGTYMVRHSEKETFIAREWSLEWFELYFTFIHPDNGRYKLAGI
jgi:hypothetical protein